ncbi:MAG: GTPase Era [Thermanaerothrix sp.]|uniref:GTPase Era n=1 Tax=Thermanaerothrix solaris TaxID=3058434 RepID=A0ABU3NPY4_9CHLR|nr:GTPase Era [Thermanaerothrix sp. 4228-RoL]MDT8898901.1 GTPase Era [Thermanaerothrix sp. 4228-RoL]
MDQDLSTYKAGFVALIGRPNVGKSTLLNAYLGQKIAAVSPKPQTTRRRQLGILTLENAQIIFMDTPGLHIPVHKLGEYMNRVAEETLEDADVLVWLVEAHRLPGEEDRLIAQRLRQLRHAPPLILALNKVDLVSGEDLPAQHAAYAELAPQAVRTILLSATTGQGRDDLLQAILEFLPVHPPYYEPDQITDYYERDIAAELIREAALLHLRDEVPHAIAVRIDEYEERDENTAYIHATLFVEKESQKPIVIGKGGEMLKKIGTTARMEIEAMSGRKIFLDLHVKVNKNWRNQPEALRWLGYTLKR